MNARLGAVLWRLMIFFTVCLLGLFALVAVFAQARFQPQQAYRALFSNVGGLKSGDFVRIAGVEVGKVGDLTIGRDNLVGVEFKVDDSVVLTQSSRAVVRFDNLYGDRYLALEAGAGGGAPLKPGDTIAAANTAPALDLDTLIGGFRPLFRALDPDQINALSGQLIQAFQGQGRTISSLLGQTATFTDALANRDALIGDLIKNLDLVLGAIGDNDADFGKALGRLDELTAALAARKDGIADATANIDTTAGEVADLLAQSRPAIQKVRQETDRAATIVLNKHDYFDDLLNTLPDAYRMLGRQGLYGDWFAFYICEAIIKVNGKGGQPVYIKAAAQTSGRCTPK
ncbi:mammalian cell entry protein [Mycolicibacterium peregrinum]|uniref:Mammalian cell entry protein n=1 Tax=Mycolicibacterium peregrinum TaxID=43304 RepID=A0A1A0QZ55_MYCPR|nr:MCE family protein [Mycolicibacterium peregrinum]OBB27198.1 mammalian cell entry protein [Mycolicibacterium peregrinum]